ncbi:acyltransferase [Proteus sp. GOKU]|uniref:acyltransferase family protein n=1 Tax=Proteus TaxID=583 RepID=UPI001892B9AF|nr:MULTISPECIES: acyltransferase family protein [Proteus]QPB79862.1 acyltransferase [Proteus sp. GOKU]QQP25869.1 acyltransferase [Proteus vulgaris]
MQKKKFRTDINGMRAIAVLLVILFHFDNSLAPAGFIGVDIFFVISGYLMTSIILTGIENNNFSIIKFYSARCKRIIPALMLLIFILVFLSYFLIEPNDYKKIGIHARDSLLFISNITYFNESGYFDVESMEKFLLHTWSLSVEWQFYLIYPLIILAISKITTSSNTRKSLVFLFFVSLILSSVITKIDPSQAYYMIHTRAWEMMAGGLAFAYPVAKVSEKNKKILFFLCLIIIIFASYFFDSNTPWPSFYASIPVVATAIILAINYEKNFILSNPIFQKIGLWSYSIYLFHWPLLVITKKLNLELSLIIYLTITFILAISSYYLIEKRRLKIVFIIPFYIIILIACQYIAKDGVTQRIDKKTQEYSKNYKFYYNPWVLYRDKQNDILYFNENLPSKKIILSGDSFALMYVEAMKEYGVNFELYSNESCNTTMINDSYKGSRNCITMKNKFLERIAKNDDSPVIISQRWDLYLKGLDKVQTENKIKLFLDNLKNKGQNRKFYILGDYHQPSYNPYSCLLNSQTMQSNFLSDLLHSERCEKMESKDKDSLRTDVDIEGIFKLLTLQYDNIEFISMRDEQCNKFSCTIIENDNPIIIKPHLTKFGAEKFTKFIMNKINYK